MLNILLLVWQDNLESLENVAAWKVLIWPESPLNNLLLSSFLPVLFVKIAYGLKFIFLYFKYKEKINIMLSDLCLIFKMLVSDSSRIFPSISQNPVESHYVDMFQWLTETNGHIKEDVEIDKYDLDNYRYKFRVAALLII